MDSANFLTRIVDNHHQSRNSGDNQGRYFFFLILFFLSISGVEASFNYNIVNGITFWSSRSAYNYWSLALLPSLVRSHHSLPSSTYSDWTIMLITLLIFSVLGCLGTGRIILQQLIPAHRLNEGQRVTMQWSLGPSVPQSLGLLISCYLKFLGNPRLHYRNQDFLKVYIWYGEYQKLICPTSSPVTPKSIIFYFIVFIHFMSIKV